MSTPPVPPPEGPEDQDHSSDSSSNSDKEKGSEKENEKEESEPEPPPIPETRFTTEAAAAVVSGVLSFVYHLVPVREPLRFKVTIGCSIDMELSTRPPYPKLFAKVFFKDTDDNPRRTRVAQWTPNNSRIDWEQDEFESLVGPGGPCDVSIQIHQDYPDEMILNKMYSIDWLKVHASINHDKTWGLPVSSPKHGPCRIYICCRCTDGRPHAVTDFSKSPLPELHAFLPNSPPPAAFRGGIASNNDNGAAGRKLFNFFFTNCREKLRQVPELLKDYAGREDYLIDMHATVYKWWDWGNDPTEVGNWMDKIPPDTSIKRKRRTVKE